MSPFPWTDYDGDSPYEDYAFATSTSTITSKTTYVPGLGQRDSATTDLAYHHGDQIESMRLMTDGGGAVVRRQIYTAFGEPIQTTGSRSTRYQYAGALGYESVTPPGASAQLTILHVGERWYDPGSGRFLQRDPIGIVGGLGLYDYAYGNPVLHTDAEGLCPRWQNQVRYPNGRFGPTKWQFRKWGPNRWFWVYGLGSGAARIGHKLAGKPYEEPTSIIWDIIVLQVDASAIDAETERMRQANAEARFVGPPAPPPPATEFDGILKYGYFCFVPGTMVQVSSHLVPIESLEIGDDVVSSDGDRLPTCATVTRTIRGTTYELVNIDIGSEVIRCTPEHPFWTAGGGWKTAGQLSTDDSLEDSQHRFIRIRGVCREHCKQGQMVYGLTVSPNQTYFVGKSRVLVHNKSL